MTKKLLLIAAVALATQANAGGLMTNTNYHVAFDRMMARGASTEIDAAYSNPAGLVWGYDGFQLSVDFQKPWQNRDIECNGVKYPGKASAPIVPALFASYKKDRLAVSSMIGIVGSGGYVKFNNGIPMFSVPVAATLAGNSITQGYALDTKMEGKQYIYGGQVNVAYRLSDNFSASVGMRANYYDGFTRGHLTAVAGNLLAGMLQQIGMLPTGKADLVNMQLDCNQTGWGFAPIVGFNTHIGPLTVAARRPLPPCRRPPSALWPRRLANTCPTKRHATTCPPSSRWLWVMSSQTSCVSPPSTISSTTRTPRCQATVKKS